MENQEEPVELLFEQLSKTPKHYYRPHTNKIQNLQLSCTVCQKKSKYVCPRC